MTDKKHDAADEEQQDHVTQNEMAEREEQEEVSHAPAEETRDVSDDTDKMEPSEAPTVAAPPLHPKHRLVAFLKTKKGKIVAAVAAVVLVLAVLLAVPFTRYALLGAVVKKDVSLTVLDNKTGKPVSEVEVTLANRTNKTDQQGKVEFKNVAVGEQKAVLKKKYYKDASQTVLLPIFTAPKSTELKIEATGRQVPVKVLNKISSKPIEKAIVSALDTAVTTDEKGEAMLVLPADKTSEKGTVKLQGYNDLAITIEVTEQTSEKNVFSVTPSGKVYFLSKRTGTINVMKSNLDGSEVQVVVAGTGKEENGHTLLVASRDWKYLALLAKRDSSKPKLYLIDTSNDKLSVMDEGNASFSLIGWADHRFVYNVHRNDAKSWEDRKQVLKSYSAETRKHTELDALRGGQDSSYPSFSQSYGSPTLIDNDLIFSKWWSGHSFHAQLEGKKSGVYSVKADGSNKKAIIETDSASIGYYETKPYGANEMYIRTQGAVGGQKTYEYEDGKLVEKSFSDEDFYKEYSVYLVSPDGNETFWSENRDGKNILFIGNEDGENERTVLASSDYRQYGWYTNDYLLVSKSGSELFVLSKDNPSQQLKITDYHKPYYSLFYGGGYGGF